jgi:2-polyprenyl-3-methyl-5-hydroxy-6-metoxy-1,4-benzoquinol methylase
MMDAGFDVVATDLEPNQPWIHAFDLDKPHTAGAISDRFDAVVCVETFEHLENPRASLRSLRSIMDVGTHLLISTPNVLHPHSRLRTLVTGEPLLFGSDAYYETGHITPLPEWLLVEHLKSAGFAVATVETAGHLGVKSRWRRLAHRFEMAVLYVIGVRHQPRRGDGLCLFIVATAVET